MRPGDPTGPSRAATLAAARNEFEAFHLVVHGGPSGVGQLDVVASDLQGPGGAVIGGDQVRVFREAFINVTTRSNVSGATGRWPDALIPRVDDLYGEKRNAFPVDVPANEQQPIFVEYHVPQTAAAGAYTGRVTVTGSGFSAEVPVRLTVHPFALPSTASLRTAFGMGWADACTAHFGGYQMCGGDAGIEKMMLLYTRLALDHRISIEESVYSGPAATASGWDWPKWDATYGPLLDGTGPTRLVGAKLTSLRYAWTREAGKYKAWAGHFRDKGWFDRTFDYTCDEPPAGCAWSEIGTRAAVAHAGDPDFRTLVTTSLTNATANGIASVIDTLVPVVNELEPIGAASTRASYDPWLAGAPNRRAWMYQSCNSHGCGGEGTEQGWPSYMIDAPATLNRAMEWASWRQRMQGELYFATTYAFTRGDAWQNQYYFGGNGDGNLFYPGTPAKIGGTKDIPIASLRMKMIRAGQEDYEYLKLTADAGDLAFADGAAQRLLPTSTGFTGDPAAIDDARAQMAARIMALKGLSYDTPPEPGATMPPPLTEETPQDSIGSPDGTPPSTLSATKSGGCSAGGSSNAAGTALLVSLALVGGLALRRRPLRDRL